MLDILMAIYQGVVAVMPLVQISWDAGLYTYPPIAPDVLYNNKD